MVEDKLARFNEAPETTDPLKNLFKSRYIDPGTGEAPQFDTARRDLHMTKSLLKKSMEIQHNPISQRKVLTAATRWHDGKSGIGGLIQGPGDVTSDSIPGGIMQNGEKVEEILVSNGEVILSGKDLAGLDPDGNIERAGHAIR